MQASDRENLMRICNGDLPAGIEAEYELLRAGWDRVKSGPMPAEILVPLAVKFGGVRPLGVLPSEWDRIPSGAAVEIYKAFNPNEKYCDGEFECVGEGKNQGLVGVRLSLDPDTVVFYPPKRVRLKGEVPKVETPRKPIPVEAPKKADELPAAEPLSEAESVEDDTEEDVGTPVEAQDGDWSGVAKDTLVDVDTGNGILTGKFVGVGNDKNPGQLAVCIPSLHKGRGKKARKFGWYDADDVVVHRDVLPIEQQVEQVEKSVETQAV